LRSSRALAAVGKPLQPPLFDNRPSDQGARSMVPGLKSWQAGRAGPLSPARARAGTSPR
jgi:hypothetical protein